MKRSEFILKTCIACLAGPSLASALASCNTVHYTSGLMSANGLSVPMSEFLDVKKGANVYRSYLLVKNDALQFPICVYRLNEQEYSALWLQCTHAGAEVQVAGDSLHCPGHGSEFDKKGTVTQGPAEENLRKFPVSIMNDQLFIDLRKK
ncbi:(2Fe-2S)-binding protein [Solitalea longa]|uniref:(2Fe-2S)-binding protein n=1 Tax=Solitalea longa TaxID=2079460 RepID=A0A2S5A1J3_9SPHI|nr:Rieske (2Fe-2S) protein [Solitalea longa]POY36425.1 (2Fe-2S)-binding protein [Solitalea longa]